MRAGKTAWIFRISYDEEIQGNIRYAAQGLSALQKMAFALKEVRDSDRDMIEIACDYGFSSHEAFTRAFKTMYGIAPSVYRKHPSPVVLRTKINPFDRCFLD